MSYFSPFYLVMVPLLMAIYQLASRKARPVILLLASYMFIWFASNKLIIYILLATLGIHYFGMWLDDLEKEKKAAIKDVERSERKLIKASFKKKEWHVLIFAIVLFVIVLFAFKYVGFFVSILNDIFALTSAPVFIKYQKIIAPIGISYYTLQCIAYLSDIYLGKIQAERNLFKLALYLAFFPCIMEGPIVRATDTLGQLTNGEPLNYHNVTFGIQRMGWGLFKKYVIADRLNIPVTLIFTNYAHYHGGTLFLGMIGYTMLLYCEFSGTMDVVIGTAQIFNITLPENFRQPFFAKNVSDFWTRWHITLGAFFRDYIYYPMSLSKPLKALTKKTRAKLGNHYGPLVTGAIALFVVWFCNGLWHGAGWTYLFYGMYHFFFILSESLTEQLVVNGCEKLHINRESKPYRIFQSFKLCIFIFVGEMFFRAPTVSQGFAMLSKTLRDFTFSGKELLKLGIDKYDYGVLIILFAISMLKEKKINVRETIAAKPIVLRWSIYYAFIIAVLIFGAYGVGYLPVAPIYADFQEDHMKYIKIIIFNGILIVALLIGSVVFTPKTNKKAFGVDYVTSNKIFSETKNTVDVIALGDSLVYSSLSPMLIYEKHGYTIYDASTPAQSIYQSYSLLKKIYKTQKPKYIFFEAESLYRRYSFEDDIQNRIGVNIPILRYHNRWKNLTLQDFSTQYQLSDRDYLKGFRYYDKVVPLMKHKKPKAKLQPYALSYLDKIMALTKAHKTKLIFMSLPCAKTWSLERHNQLEKFFKEIGYDFVDFNTLPLNIDWNMDSRDGGDHLNYNGAKKASKYFGKYLAENYDLEDHRKDPKYANYELSLVLYKQRIKQKEMKTDAAPNIDKKEQDDDQKQENQDLISNEGQ